MKNLTPTRSLTALLGLFATALIAGCHSQPIAHGEDFYTDKDETAVGKLAKAQCSVGAKQDGMLYDQHFHGGDLNSLGQVKLNLIVKGTPAGDPVYVYLNMPHDQVAARQSAVSAYLKTAGIPDTKVIVAEGPQTNPTTPTAYNLGGLYKADGTSYSGAATADSTASGSSSGMSSAGH
jgi:hypothetical protein